jgi:hypothetical protein
MALVVVAHLVHARTWFLFENGDAFTTVLLTRSLAAGQPQDWAMSPVLFVPETAGYWLLSLLGLSVRATLTLAAVGNLVALYAAVRVAAGARRARAGRPVVGALTGFAFFCVLALLDGGAHRAGYQLPSMLASTTYYSATVVATVLTLGLLRRAVDRRDLRGRVGVTTCVAIAAVAAVSTFSNPLYAGWATVPAVLVLVVLAVRTGALRRVGLTLATVLVGGTLVGLAARVPMSRWIVADGADYLRVRDWSASLAHYRDLAAQTTTSATGAAALVLTVGAWLACAPLAWLALGRRGGVPGRRAGTTGAALLALVALVAPLVALVAAVAAGSFPERYLQPWVFLPAVALTAAPDLVRDAVAHRPRSSRASRAAPVVAGVALVTLLVAAGSALPRLAPTAASDADVRCVSDWVDASGRTGAGQFWTVRAPKAELADPRRLVQVDRRLGVYTWLTNRTDRAAGRVTFLVDGPRTAPWALPNGARVADATRVDCGAYTILDLGGRALPLGPSSP